MFDIKSDISLMAFFLMQRKQDFMNNVGLLYERFSDFFTQTYGENHSKDL